MEKMRDLDKESLVNELRLGREVARQLQVQLNEPYSSQETREMLVQNLVASYEKALSMLNLSSNSTMVAGEPQHNSSGVAIRMSESPPLSGSPRSEDSDREFKDQDSRDVSRKRKNMPRWTQQVRVSPVSGIEGSLDDGFCWRKYGQKDILGAKYPRGYYRCTYRNVQGCLATKQVQRSDEDPFIFEITYRGRHTCTQVSNSSSPQLPAQNNNADLTNNTELPHPQNQSQPHDMHQQQQQQQQQDILFNFRKGLKVITDDLDSHVQPSYPTVFFPSTSNIKPENQVLSPPIMESFAGNFSPSFISPNSTSETSYFSVSPNRMQQQSFGIVKQNFHNSESELTDIISAATSGTKSPTVGFDFPFGNVDFDPNFTFDGPGFLP